MSAMRFAGDHVGGAFWGLPASCSAPDKRRDGQALEFAADADVTIPGDAMWPRLTRAKCGMTTSAN